MIVIFDIIFELIFKSNILGFKSFMPGRIASFAGQELNIGHFFSAFSLIFMSYVYNNYKNISLKLLIAILEKMPTTRSKKLTFGTKWVEKTCAEP